MEQEKLADLANKIGEGTATDEEIASYNLWFNSFNIEREWPAALGNEDKKKDFLLENINRTIRKTGSVRKIWPAIAAAAVILISIGAYFILSQQKLSSRQPAQRLVTDVTAGKYGATLTLSTGQQVILAAKPVGPIALQGNVPVVKASSGLLTYSTKALSAEDLVNKITTRNKEQYAVSLSDGTTAWLNAASSISYPVTFTGKTRLVKITGEVYFEVQHNAQKPFIVMANGQKVEVLGTHFNINAYNDEGTIKTTLLQGIVRVSTQDQSAVKQLLPGEMAINNGSSITVSKADAEQAIAWKNGYFDFNDEPLENIMHSISRWYDVDIDYQLKSREPLVFGGKVSRGNNLSAILKIMESTGTVHFKIEGRRVTVMN